MPNNSREPISIYNPHLLAEDAEVHDGTLDTRQVILHDRTTLRQHCFKHIDGITSFIFANPSESRGIFAGTKFDAQSETANQLNGRTAVENLADNPVPPSCYHHEVKAIKIGDQTAFIREDGMGVYFPWDRARNAIIGEMPVNSALRQRVADVAFLPFLKSLDKDNNMARAEEIMNRYRLQSTTEAKTSDVLARRTFTASAILLALSASLFFASRCSGDSDQQSRQTPTSPIRP